MGVSLDDLDEIRRIDPSGMLDLILGVPNQVAEAYTIGGNATVPPTYGDVDNVVISGLGGSAIGGDLLRSLVVGEAKVPVYVNRDYDIPAFVGSRTLFIASSYSGNTEETLSAFEQAKSAGAKILCISTGGKLVEMAKQAGVPYISIPAGLSPRAALGYSLVPLWVVFQKLHFIADKSSEFDETVDVLTSLKKVLGPDSPESVNQAKKLARKFHGNLPIIYGVEGWRGIVAQRWKGQINENSKAPAYWNVYPELDHNEIVGWKSNPEILKKMRVVNLRDSGETKQIKRRIEVTSEVIAKLAGSVDDVWAMGRSSLAKLFSLVYIGDFISLYLAVLNHEDPTPVDSISYLKQKLAAPYTE